MYYVLVNVLFINFILIEKYYTNYKKLIKKLIKKLTIKN
jgi:hypothetical protein